MPFLKKNFFCRSMPFCCCCFAGFSGSSVVNNLPANTGDTRDVGLIPGSGRSPREGNGNPLQYSCLENLMDRGAWWAAVHGVAKSWARLSDWHLLTYSTRDSQESSPAPKFESITSLAFNFLYGPTLTTIHYYSYYC